MGRPGIRDLKTRVVGCSISREGPDCTVEVYRSEESEKEVIELRVGTQKGEASGVRAAKSSEFGEGE